MLVYLVSWIYNKDLAKGKGKIPKSEHFFGFSVLCRNSQDAIRCLQYHFYKVFSPSSGITPEDGEIRLQRQVLDSRGFNVNYMLMDGIREPFELNDLKSNLSRLTSIFGYERRTM